MPKPNSTDSKYKTWKVEHNMVMSWLVNSITNEVGENLILHEMTQEIWDVVKKMYSDTKDTAEALSSKHLNHLIF